MTIDRILSVFATIVSVVAVPASGYLSYHYAIKGEKRKEWNALAEPIHDYFFKRGHEHDDGKFYTRHEIPFKQIIPIRRRFNRMESACFEKRFTTYVHISNYFSKEKIMTERTKLNLCKAAKSIADDIMLVVKIK